MPTGYRAPRTIRLKLYLEQHPKRQTHHPVVVFRNRKPQRQNPARDRQGVLASERRECPLRRLKQLKQTSLCHRQLNPQPPC